MMKFLFCCSLLLLILRVFGAHIPASVIFLPVFFGAIAWLMLRAVWLGIFIAFKTSWPKRKPL